MRRLLALVLVALLPLAAPAIDYDSRFEDPGQQARFERLTNELRCLVCQNQTIADSNAELALDLRRQTREMILAGKTDAEILQFMTDRYGDFVLYRPPLKPTTWLLWGAPVILLLIGAVAMVVVVRRKTQEAAGEPAPDVDGERL
jgi:cytochrome c-type biogenesis protein CcmH